MILGLVEFGNVRLEKSLGKSSYTSSVLVEAGQGGHA